MAETEESGAEQERSIRHVHAGLVGAAHVRASLDALTAHNVRPVSAALSLVFAAHAVVYAVQPTLVGHALMESYSAVSSVAYALIWALTRRVPEAPGRANPTGFVIGVIAGANCVAGVFLHHTQQSALLTVLAIIAVAIFARSTVLFGVLVVAIAGSWFLAAAWVLPLTQWEDQILPIGSAVGLSAAAHLVFRRTERRLQQTRAQLALAAAVDELTGIYNRRGFVMVGQQLLRQAIHAHVPVTLLFLDVDHMKVINDSTGHAAGDETLRELGDVLRATFREADVIGRLGGDEFSVLMVGSQEHLAAQRLRDAVAQHNAGTPARRLMISVGEVHYLGDARETLQMLIARGDAEMYADKARRRSA